MEVNGGGRFGVLEDSSVMEVLSDWKKQESAGLVKRDAVNEVLKLLGKEVIDVVGVRRCGKSSLLLLIIKELNIGEERVLYVNFDDPAFANYYGVELLDKIWEVYLERVNPKASEKSGKPFVFLDEVQLVTGWEKWVRKLRDLRLANVFVTGSSSALLSREVGTSLTGRHLTVTMHPLSFKEFVRFKNERVPENDSGLASERIKLKRLFNAYLNEGGFPEVALTGNTALLKNYFEDILYRDIVARHDVRDFTSLRRLAVYCLTNVSNPITYNSLRKQFGLSLDSVKSYLSFFEEAFLVFQVPVFSYSLKTQEVAPRKIYCVDNGLRNAVSFKFSGDAGRLAENAVFNELKRSRSRKETDGNVFYWRDANGKRECDFLVQERGAVTQAIQVCWDLNAENKERETAGLLAALNEFKLSDGVIVTRDFEGVEKIGGLGKKTIAFTPLWKWLLRV